MKALRIHPATFLFIFLLILTGYYTVIFPYLIAITLHELGHAFVAKKLGYKLDKIWILPFGACLSFEEFSFNPDDEVKIAFAGPIVNILLIIISITFWWIFPETYVFSYTFTLSNFFIAFFNLLPAYPLDGGRVLTGILRMNYKNKKVYKIACILNLIFCFIFCVMFVFSIFFNINFTFITIAIFLFISTFEGKFQGNYSPLLYKTSCKKFSRPISVKSFCIPSSMPFYRILPEINANKYNMIYVLYPNDCLKLITERQFQRILEKHSLGCSFDDLRIKKDFD